MNHCSTVQERVNMVSQMPTYGLVSHLGCAHQVSRQTLYRWASKGRQALEAALGSHLVPGKQEEAHAFFALTLLIETHASYRGIQTCLQDLHGIHLSLGKIAGIVKKAGSRTQNWLNHQQATTARTLALDEQYSSQRGKGYLNVIDVHSGQVWASVPPVPTGCMYDSPTSRLSPTSDDIDNGEFPKNNHNKFKEREIEQVQIFSQDGRREEWQDKAFLSSRDALFLAASQRITRHGAHGDAAGRGWHVHTFGV